MSTPAANPDAPQAEAQENGQQPSGPDFAPVMERLDQLNTEIAPVIEYAQAQMQSAQGQGTDPDADYQNFIDSLFGGEGGQDPAGADPYQQQVPQVPQFLQDPQLFQQLIDRAVERGVDQRVGARLEAFESDRLERQVGDLIEELPGLKDPKTQQETVLAAQQIAHEMGQPEAWRHPAFIRMAHLARLAEQRSDEEVPADASGGGATLEGGSGGNPGGQEPSLREQLIGAHRGQSPGDFTWF